VCLHGGAGRAGAAAVALKVLKLGMDTRSVIARFGRTAGARHDGAPEHCPGARRRATETARLTL